MKQFREFIYNQHDNICNQKYADKYPYSMHLSFVEAQGRKFIHLLDSKTISNRHNNLSSKDKRLLNLILMALISHDCLEDARMTYNNLVETIDTLDFNNRLAAQMVADIVYCVTDEKGKSRKERKNDKYYSELKENQYAVFVKLADLAANTLFSKLSGSSMYEKYKKEFPFFKEKVYIEEYKEFFDYVENL